MAEVNLRPYLFVTKDRKDYFGATSVLSRRAAVAEKLLGSMAELARNYIP